ncbi:MAG: hypothetical protein GF330_06125 [Candidatus Eisenbacteria bacterium]|nr:hypothetical protein [Candidatus Eisenbacteria bacterium]
MLQRTVRGSDLIALSLSVLLAPAVATGEIQSFSGPLAGTVIAGEEPGGGMASGTEFSDMILDVLNQGGGPSSLIVFDSSAPTGGDYDLGTPNEDFGGPGIGSGGRAGQPGENGTAQGNLLIIAEEIHDGDGDGLVDDPDDEGGGGQIRFAFYEPVELHALGLVDIDDRSSAMVELYLDDQLLAAIPASSLGNNSYETLDLTGHGAADLLVLTLQGSGGVAFIDYVPPTTPTRGGSWGAIKHEFLR